MRADPSVDANRLALTELLNRSSDFMTSDFSSGDRRYRAYYLETMIETAIVHEHLVRPLLDRPDASVRDTVSVLECKMTYELADAASALISGKTVLQIDGEATLYLLGTELKKERSVNLPVNERVLRGSNEALIENLNTNVNLLRKIVATPELVVKYYRLGSRSNTKVALVYMQTLANEQVLKEFERRVGAIDIDYVEAPGFVQELIQDRKFSLFPQLLVTERPDRVRSYLLDGKIAVLTDGSPDCLLAPVSFWAFFQSPDDYQIGWLLGSTFRLLRIVCFFLAIGLPGAYVALVTFDPRILPFEIALTLQSSMQYIAMPPVMEAIVMLLTLEILREATVRLASPIGQTIGVVGGIVIGTVVVQSNLISNMMVIIAAFTGVASFIIPSYEMSSAARFLTYPVIVLSATFGLIGWMLAFLLILAHLARMNTMGIPYFHSGLSPGGWKDTFLRGPLVKLNRRAEESLAQDERRLRDPGRRPT